DRTAELQCPVENLFRTLEITNLYADLSERCERDRQAMPRADFLVDGHTALGEGKRLLMTVAHEGHVRLVVHDAREHVVGFDGSRETLGLPQRPRRFVVPSGLRQQHRRQRVREREMPAVTRGMQG